jgi:hypothetical protein
MQLFQSDINHDAKLSFEISGKVLDTKVEGKYITELSQTAGKWNQINYIYSLPNSFYMADLIKIYVYNPSDTEIKIDDFKIEFLK